MTGTTPEDPTTTGPSRRQVLVTGGVVVAAAAVTAACGSGGGSGGGPTANASGTTLKTSEVPEGGGTILTEAQVVVTQPSAGVYQAFSAVCTHEGCLVAQVAQGAITCPCHGAQFSISDGAVLGGPAPAPLAAVPMTVSGDTITLS